MTTSWVGSASAPGYSPPTASSSGTSPAKRACSTGSSSTETPSTPSADTWPRDRGGAHAPEGARPKLRSMVRRLLVGLTRHRVITGAALVVIGAAAVVAAVLADLGRWPYLTGAVLVALGACLFLSRLLRRPAALGASSLAVALVVGTGAWLGLHGWPGEPPHWEEADSAGHLSEGSYRRGHVLFTEGVAHDVATGETLWSTEDDDTSAIAATDEVLLLDEPTDDEGRRRISARLIDNGHQVWWADVGDSPRAVASNAGVVVIGSGAGSVGLDMTTGDQLWTSSRRAGAECKHGEPQTLRTLATDQAVVFLPSPGKDSRVDLARVDDGQTLVRDIECLNYGRVVGSTYVEHGADGLIGRSVRTGATTWQRDWIHDAEPFALPDSHGTIYIPDRTRGGVVESYHALDLRTGEDTTVRPPDGWTARGEATRDQRADVLWQPVRHGDRVGLWQVGTQHLVTFPSSTTVTIGEADESGWVAVVGSQDTIVGESVRTTWAVSPEGRVFGPFTGGSDTADGRSTIDDGILRVGSRVYPLD